jgi:hypothetical protein
MRTTVTGPEAAEMIQKGHISEQEFSVVPL